MTPAEFLRLMHHHVEQQSLLPESGPVIVGVSGGIDSMVLLDSLHRLVEDGKYDLELHIAHLNHKIRGQADDDAAAVEAIAHSYNLPCTVEACDVEAIMAEQSGSLEEVARRERYAFFQRACLKTGAKHVAVGHHADDNAETILHRIVRGTGLRGLGGIRAVRQLDSETDLLLIRPLLRFTRKQIEEYAAQQGLAFREDHTNFDREQTRNRIRHDILPMLARDINPRVSEALVRLGEQAQWAEDYLRQTARRMLETLIVSRTDQELRLNAKALQSKSRIVQAEIVRYAILWFEIGEQAMGFEHLVSILDLIADPASGKQLKLPEGLLVTKRYDRLIFTRPTPQPREDIWPEIALHVPGETRLVARRIELQCTIEDGGYKELQDWLPHRTPRTEWLDCDQVRLPLVVRPPVPGQRFWPLGAPGSKKVSDFFTGKKVDPSDRERAAIVCDQLGPIWVVGYRIDDRVKVTRATRRLLKMSARKLET